MKIGNYEVTWYQALAVALTILFFYMVLTRIFGHSVTDLSIVISLFGMLCTWLYNLNREVGEVKTKFNEFKQEFKEFKNQVGKEFSELKQIIKG